MSIVSALCDSYIKEQMDDGLHKAADIYMIALIKSGSTGVFDALTTNYSQLGCLLYTSPSPRDYAASRMPSSA